MLPLPFEARSSLNKDETESGFAPGQSFTGFMAWLKGGISPAARAGVTSPLIVVVSFSMHHSPSRKLPSLKPRKGDTEVSIHYYDGMNDICMGVVGPLGGVSFFRTPHVSEDRGIVSHSSIDLKDTALTHNHGVAIFEAVKKGTFDDKGGKAVTEFILDDKLGDSDPITGENLVHAPFKHPWFMSNDFDPDSDDEISGGK